MNILIAGDFVPGFRVADQIENGDYSCLNEIKPIIQSVDYSIVNLESPIVVRNAKPIDKTGPNLKCSERAMECLVDAGFKCVTLANNHFRDYGQIGVEDTISSCKKYEIDYVGGGINIDEAQQVCYKEINDQKLAIINICEKEWSIATSSFGGSAPLNPITNFYSIQQAKAIADYVIVIVHGGIEHYQFPTPRMVETYRFFVDAGADVVVNHHQHCYSGYEVYNGKPIFYGLGNFCFDKDKFSNVLWEKGYMVNIKFEEDRIDYELLPYTQCASLPCVELITEEDKIVFFEHITKLNNIIQDNALLTAEFERYVQRVGKSRMLEFEPFDNKYIRALQRKHIIPSFLSERTQRVIFNFIKCETHQEVIIKTWSEHFSRSKRK